MAREALANEGKDARGAMMIDARECDLVDGAFERITIFWPTLLSPNQCAELGDLCHSSPSSHYSHSSLYISLANEIRLPLNPLHALLDHPLRFPLDPLLPLLALPPAAPLFLSRTEGVVESL